MKPQDMEIDMKELQLNEQNNNHYLQHCSRLLAEIKQTAIKWNICNSQLPVSMVNVRIKPNRLTLIWNLHRISPFAWCAF